MTEQQQPPRRGPGRPPAGRIGIHITLPKELVKTVDRLRGPVERSQIVERALQQYLNDHF